MNWAEKASQNIKKIRVNHRNWSRALSEAFSMMVASAPGEVLCITGPSRAGKSKLIAELCRIVVGSDSCYVDGVMPVATLLATNCSTAGSFSTKSFTIRALNTVKHPFYSISPKDDWNVENLYRLERVAEGILRPALEQALIHRGVIYLFIDEAQHIRYSRGRGRDAAAILDSWKCLAQTAKVVLVLVGAYPLLDVLRQCPHLIGRKHTVHLPRYYPNKDDLIAFEQILEAYSRNLKFSNDVESLRDWREYLYSGSFGCIGLLEGWLREALALVIAHKSETLTFEHLTATQKSKEDLKSLASEIKLGEKALLTDENMARCGSHSSASAYEKKNSGSEKTTAISGKEFKYKEVMCDIYSR